MPLSYSSTALERQSMPGAMTTSPAKKPNVVTMAEQQWDAEKDRDGLNSYLTVSGVSKRYGNVWALRDVSLTIAKTDFIAILGPSGSGKSTLLRLIAGLDQPSAGGIAIDGSDVTKLPPHKRGVGMVFQDFLLFPHRTVRENLAFPLRMNGSSKDLIAERIDWVIGILSLEGLADRYPNQLSGGQQQRVALGRGLVAHPKLLLLDEPLANLDRELRQEMEVEIRRYQKRLQIPFIYVTHNQEEALSMSDRIAVIHNGRLETFAPRREVYDSPATPFVARFVGRSNKFTGIVDRQAACVRLDQLDCTAPLPPDSAFSDGETIDIFVKNERVRVERAGNGIACVVQDVIARGPFDEYILVTQSGLVILASLRKDQQTLSIGDQIVANWHDRDCHLFPSRPAS